MPTDDHHYQARLAMAEQIGETRAKIEIALVWLTNNPAAADNVSVQRAIELLKEAEAGLLELRRAPKRTEEELLAAVAASTGRLEQQENRQ